MHLYVDGKLSENNRAPDATVDDVIASVRTAEENRGAAILGLVCDGIDMFGPELESVLAKKADQFTRIDIELGDPRTLVLDALKQAEATLDVVEKQRLEVVAFFGAGKTGEAMNLLGECIGDWSRINDVVSQSIALLAGKNDAVRQESAQIVQALKPVMKRLAEVKVAIQNKDFVALSDILEYEFDEIAGAWRGIIETLTRHSTAPVA